MQTVKKLRKWVLSSFDNLTDSQHRLVTTSRGIEEEWQRKEYVQDTSVVDAWCKAFREELLFQLGLSDDPTAPSGERKSLSESAMATTLDAAHVLSRTAGPESEQCFSAHEIVPLLTRYLVQSGSTMPRKLRDSCGAVLTTITSTHPTLLTELLCGVLPHLNVHAVPDLQTPPAVLTPRPGDGSGSGDRAAQVPPVPATDTSTSSLPVPSTAASPTHMMKPRVTGHQLYLATLLVNALSKSVAALNPAPPRWLDDPSVLSLVEAHVLSTYQLVAALTNTVAPSSSVSLPPLSAASTQPNSPATTSVSRAGSPTAFATSLFSSAPSTNTANNNTNNSGSGNNICVTSSTNNNSVPASSEITTREDSERAAVVVYTALIGCLYRGQTEHKQQLLCTRSQALAQCWLSAVQRLSRLPRSVSVGPGKEAVVVLETVHFWQSTLVEMILELATEGCFTQCRLRAFSGAARTGSLGSSGSITGSSMRDVGATHGLASTPGGHHSSLGSRFEPIPVHWDTLLTGGGSPSLWMLAALLPTCPVLIASLPFLENCLMGLDTSNPYAETVYRSLVCSLMLFCAGNPCTSNTFASHGLFNVLIALLTYQQESVFPARVAIEGYPDASDTSTECTSCTTDKDEPQNTIAFVDPVNATNTTASVAIGPPRTIQTVAPAAQLSSNTAQLTSSFIASLAALTFPTKLLRALMNSVEAMCRGPTCQTDVDLVESLLHVVATSYTPTHVLFFPGSGSVVCSVHRFVGRWSGYSFSAWINPICVWPQGSLLFSVTDHAGGTTELLLVANGRSCCLALRLSSRASSADGGVNHATADTAMASMTAASAGSAGASTSTSSGTPTFLVIPGSALPAEAWSHIAFTHGLVDPHVYVNGQRLDIPVSLPFPKEASRRHRLQIALGGLIGETSFVGFVARMDVLDGGLSDSEITKLYEAGPAKAASADYHTLLSLRCREATLPETTTSAPVTSRDATTTPTAESTTPSLPPSQADHTCSVSSHKDPRMEEDAAEASEGADPLTTLPGSPVCLSGSLVGKREGISMHGIIPFLSTDMKSVFAECDAVNWALRVLEVAPQRERLVTIARLCVCFLTTPMRMAQTMSEREQAVKGGAALDALHRQILLWPDTYVDLPSTLLTAVTIPGATSRLLAPHATTQKVITTLLDRLRVVSGELTAGACPSDRLNRNPTTTSSILRELSDTLLVRENVKLFLAVPERFLQVLSLSLHLPLECIESVVMLIEKLCKAQEELEATLRFLLATHRQPTAGQAKAEIVRMLFDVSRANPSMCDMISSCFKGTGVYFLLELIHGNNHSSEAIRVYTLRLLSLILYTSKKQREAFLKCEGFALLKRAITDPASLVPIRLPTLDCLFHMAFQSFRPTESIDAALVTRLKNTGHTRAISKLSTSSSGAGVGAGDAEGSGAHRTHSHRTTAKGALGVTSMPGHLPGLISRRLRVVHREFSFEVKRDFATRASEDRWQSDDAYRGKGIEGALTLPQALETALGVLGFLIVQSAGSTAHPGTAHEATMAHLSAPPSSLPLCSHPTPHDGGGAALPLSGAAAQGSSAESTASEEERLEDVILPGLGYLEKIVDVRDNAEALVRTHWLHWLWQAVSPVLGQTRSSVSAGAALAAATAAHTGITVVPALASPTAYSSDGLPPSTAETLDDACASPTTPSVMINLISQDTRSPTSPAPSGTAFGPRFTRRFASEVVARTRGIVRRVVALEMRLSSKSPTVRRVRGTLMAPQLVRIVLEESVRYFSRAGHSDLSDPDSAVNVVKNLNALLEDVEELLLPFPATLGIEVVTFISTIAVNSNSWVRMRMKNSSSLFQTRDNFAFFLMCTMRRLTKVRPQQLIQLLDACTCNPNTMVVLLGRLRDALNAKDVNELERVLLLLRHLIISDVEQSDQLAELLGARGSGLAEILTKDASEDYPLRLPSDDESPLADLGRGSSAFSVSTNAAEGPALATLPTVQVVEWRQSHPEDYTAVAERLSTESRDTTLAIRAQEERVAKSRAALAKATRTVEQRHAQEEEKISQEFQRIVQTVQSERARKSA